MSDINNILKKIIPIKNTRLAARVVGTIWLVICLLGIVIFFLMGTEKHIDAAPESTDVLGIVTLVFFFIAFLGLIIAWWRSGIGGFISLFGFVISGVLFKLNPDLIFIPPFFVIVLLPSILYLADWWSANNQKP